MPTSVARHDLLARAQLFFVFSFDHPRDSANSLNTKLLRSAWESPARFAGAPCPQRIRAAAVSGGLVLALTGGAISGWVVGVRTGAGGMRSFLRRPFCGGRPGSSAPPPRRWRRSRLYLLGAGGLDQFSFSFLAWIPPPCGWGRRSRLRI
jgi:hypothetical protein